MRSPQCIDCHRKATCTKERFGHSCETCHNRIAACLAIRSRSTDLVSLERQTTRGVDCHACHREKVDGAIKLDSNMRQLSPARTTCMTASSEGLQAVCIRRSRFRELRTRDEAQARMVATAVLVPGFAFAQVRQSSTFDHFTTGFDLDGAHRRRRLRKPATSPVLFRVRPRSAVRAMQRRTHSRFGQACQPCVDDGELQRCHRTTAWAPVRMNHDAVFAHLQLVPQNNVFSVGKPPQHLVTQADCDTCQRTTAWVPAHFSHVGITQSCASLPRWRRRYGQEQRPHHHDEQLRGLP